MNSDPNDTELRRLVLEADEEGFANGIDPKGRSWQTVSRVMQRLGYLSYVRFGSGVPPVLSRIEAILQQLYRTEDVAMGGVHMGAFMFRDVFAKVSIPIAYGTVGINPLEFIDLNPAQRQWLASRPEDLDCYLNQFADIFDFGWGRQELGHRRIVNEDCRVTLRLAHFQLQGAAAIVTGAYDFRGAIQAALLAAELVLKGGLAVHGIDEKMRKKKYNHDLVRLLNALSPLEPSLDSARIRATIDTFPDYVANRYAADQPGRLETGHIVMGAQYIAGEVMRQLTDRHFLSLARPPVPRVYPPLAA